MMAFALRASASVRAVLRSLRDDPDRADVWQAVSERIALIRTDPAAPRARGVERQMQPSGVLARATSVAVPDSNEMWIVVWHLAHDDSGDAIELVRVERWSE